MTDNLPPHSRPIIRLGTHVMRSLAMHHRFIFLACVAASALAMRAAGDGRAWVEHDGYRSTALAPVAALPDGFTSMPPGESGIRFTNRLSEAAGAANRLLEIGSGVALGDVDGDGWVDIYLCRVEGGNALYRNLGQWKFEEITASAGVACAGRPSTGAVLVDLDGDRDLDLLVNRLGGGTKLFRNQGRGRFVEDGEAGLFPGFGATSMALADVEGDGDLDLYVTNYRTDTFFDQPAGLKMEMRRTPEGGWVLEPQGRFVTVPQGDGPPLVIERGEIDVFYVNRGRGRFAPVAWETGLFLKSDGRPLSEPPTDWGLSVMFRDLNGDRHPDLYICNDFIHWPDRIWLNQGGRRFKAASPQACRSFSVASMAVDVADINRDGIDDLFVADMLSPRRAARARQRPDLLQGKVSWPVRDPDFTPEIARNTFFLGRGDGTYAEIAQFAGVAATDWTPAALFLDVDLDGWEDLLLATGNVHDVQDADGLAAQNRGGGRRTIQSRLEDLARLPDRRTPSMAFRNRHDLRFEDVAAKWGFDLVGVAQGFAVADLDNDGDLDVVMNCMNSAPRILRNNATGARVAVQLKGLGENTSGVGARITVRGGPVTQSQEIIAGGRYAASDAPMRSFAAGTAAAVEIEVLWRSGRRSRIKAAAVNQLHEIDESVAEEAAPVRPPTAPGLFSEVNPPLGHRHVDQAFDDFRRQPLLPRRLSTDGPGLAWADLDGDGDDDLAVGGGRGGRLQVYRNEGRKGFSEWTNAVPGRLNLRDQTTILSRPSATGRALVVGESNWEDGDEGATAGRVYGIAATGADAASAGFGTARAATGPMSQADVDRDGDLDLFVGGRARAGRYPEPATSTLLAWADGGWTIRQEFSALGLVSGSVFTDIDGDGDPDLALACDWDSIRVFRNDAGRFTEITGALGLDQHRGFWNGIASGDFDGDGRLDLVASNWGLNWRNDQPAGDSLPPVTLHYGVFAGDGVVHPLVASLDPMLGKTTLWRDRKAVVAALPFVAARFPDHKSYGLASVEEILADASQPARRWIAGEFRSMVFLNRGDRFEPKPLPVEAQFAPGFGVAVGDLDGDGHEDVFLAQNFFGVDPETSRQDAGTGLVLLGDGRGEFRALDTRAAGFSLSGEQRGCALSDFDGDGRLDLAVGQNGGSTRLFRNQGARPALRVVLKGRGANPTAIGAVVRLVSARGTGPAREIQSGSGWWSQNGTVQIMARPDAPTAVIVRWPGGRVTQHALSLGMDRIELAEPDGG